MVHTTEGKSCICADDGDGAQAAFMALRYHFGMLLGVTDFETEQHYHRGKMRLHNQWLHREGVVWGYDVQVQTDKGEIRVLPGLALDALGRELHLDADACLNVAAWFEAHRKDAGFEFTDDAASGAIAFDAHVVIRFKTCLTRQVPALSEPCEHAGTTTAYSRVFETVEILLRPGKAPAAPVPPYHRLRLLFGLDEPVVKEGAILAADQEALDAPKDLASFRKFAALDEIDLKPPEGNEFSITLAGINGITLTKDGEALKLTAGTVDVTVRPSHVATGTIQELLCGSPDKAGVSRVVAGSIKIEVDAANNGKVTLEVDPGLAAESVKPAQFSLTTFAEASGWQDFPITAATLEADKTTVTINFTGPLSGEHVRLIARGSGSTPLLGVNGVPFNNGRDFVHMQKWS